MSILNERGLSHSARSRIQSAEKNAAPAPKKVLVVEDDQDLDGILSRALRSVDPNVEIDWATNADDAYGLMRRASRCLGVGKEYDLAIIDIFIEDRGTGIEIWRAYQEICPGGPVILSSVLPFDQFLRTIGEDEICPPYLEKPYSFGELRQMMSGVLRYHDGTWGEFGEEDRQVGT